MTFKQKSATFIDLIVLFIAFAGLYFAIFPVLGARWGILLVLSHIILFFYLFRNMNEQITIDTNGIACRKAEKLLWTYKWAEIAGLKRFSYAGHPAVGILLYENERNVESTSAVDRFFQLSKSAKKALATYYTPKKDQVR